MLIKPTLEADRLKKGILFLSRRTIRNAARDWMQGEQSRVRRARAALNTLRLCKLRLPLVRLGAHVGNLCFEGVEASVPVLLRATRPAPREAPRRGELLAEVPARSWRAVLLVVVAAASSSSAGVPPCTRARAAATLGKHTC